jgi:thiamine-phosphate pyrophosphorylase
MRCLPSPPVQLITGPWRDAADLRARVEAALRGGIRWVQLRANRRSGRELYDAAMLLAPMLREAGAMFVVNDRVDVALAVGADGVHLPEAGMAAADARRLLGADAWIARSVHSVDAIAASSPGDVDAFQFGPVFETASKREFGEPQGLGRLGEAATAAHARRARLLAVGGLTAERAAACLGAGANAASVIGAIWDAAEVEASARRFRDVLPVNGDPAA